MGGDLVVGGDDVMLGFIKEVMGSDVVVGGDDVKLELNTGVE